MGTWSGATPGITTTSGPGRKRFAITHDANSNDFYIKAKMGTNSPTQTTRSGTFTPYSNYLYFGGTGNNLLAEGTINKAEIYDVVLDDDTINAFFA